MWPTSPVWKAPGVVSSHPTSHPSFLCFLPLGLSSSSGSIQVGASIWPMELTSVCNCALYLFGCLSNVHPPPRRSTKAAVGLGSACYFHRPPTQKELVCYSLNNSANKTYCEPPRQGEVIQPLLNWSEHSPPRRLYGGGRIVQENSLESVETGTEGK